MGVFLRWANPKPYRAQSLRARPVDAEAGDPAAARDQLAALLPVREQASGAQHPWTLAARHEIARWTGQAGDPANARDQLAGLLPLLEQVIGPEHPRTLTTRHELAHWTGQAGNPAAARDLFAALLPIREQVLAWRTRTARPSGMGSPGRRPGGQHGRHHRRAPAAGAAG
jgi:hypothetical protein